MSGDDSAGTNPESEYGTAARAFLDRGMARYGLPASLYESNLRALIDPNAHDFRLTELATVTGDTAMGTTPLKFLDIGCGPGTLVFRGLRAGHDAYGVDLDDGKIDLAKKWLRAQNLPEAWSDRVVICDAGKLPFENESFDLVSSYHVLEHVSDLRSVLYEAVRVTKRGGWLDLRAPDYRMSYDTHYCMPWPRFMPRAQAEKWTAAMGRPADGIGTFFYVTAPEVAAVLEALGCRIQTNILREHYQSRITPFSGRLTIDPIIVRSDADLADLAAELKSLEAAGQLPPMYATCLEFTIAAQRL